MVLQRWYLSPERRRMHETIDRLWRGFFPTTDGAEMEGWAVPLDVVERGDDILVQASLPDTTPDDIQVSIENNVLTIKFSRAESKRAKHLKITVGKTLEGTKK